MKRIYVEETDGVCEIALTDGKKLLHYEKEEAGGIHPEQIYLCRVERLMPGLEAAFVRLDETHTGFLPFDACPEKPRGGDMFPVQVRRAPVGEKQANVTRDITLAGRLLILTPYTEKISVSSKIQDKALRQQLKDMAQGILPQGMGAVLRTECASAPREAVAREAEMLAQKWQKAETKAAHGAVCGLLLDRESALVRLLRSEHGEIGPVVSNTELPDCPLPCRVQPAPFQLENVRAQWKRAHERKIPLDCGGYLVVDRTEALTVIDVNSGSFKGRKSGAENAFAQLNREAAEECARIIRLRNMGGMILIDFVDMREEENRQEIISLLREKFAQDPVKVTLYGFTALGLMELARKRTEEEHG